MNESKRKELYATLKRYEEFIAEKEGWQEMANGVSDAYSIVLWFFGDLDWQFSDNPESFDYLGTFIAEEFKRRKEAA